MTTPIDDRAEPPEQPEGKKTVNLPAMTDRALLEDLRSVVTTGFREQRRDFELLGGQFESLTEDVRGLQSWRVRTEDKLALNSMRAQQTSESSLEHEAKIAATIIKQNDLEKAIHETRAKVEQQPTKEDIAKANEIQAEAIVAAVLKTPTAQKLKNALVPVLMVAISIIGLKLTMMLSKLEEKQPAPAAPVVQLAPVIVYADAGGDR